MQTTINKKDFINALTIGGAMAGNSIVVDVLLHLFRKMFVEVENENNQLTLF